MFDYFDSDKDGLISYEDFVMSIGYEIHPAEGLGLLIMMIMMIIMMIMMMIKTIKMMMMMTDMEVV